jgi:hypothetical protein
LRYTKSAGGVPRLVSRVPSPSSRGPLLALGGPRSASGAPIPALADGVAAAGFSELPLLSPEYMMNCHSSVLGQVWGGTWNCPLRPYLLGSTVFPTTRCLFLPLLPPFQNAITFHFDRLYHIPHIPHAAPRHLESGWERRRQQEHPERAAWAVVETSSRVALPRLLWLLTSIGPRPGPCYSTQSLAGPVGYLKVSG